MLVAITFNGRYFRSLKQNRTSANCSNHRFWPPPRVWNGVLATAVLITIVALIAAQPSRKQSTIWRATALP